MGHLISKTDAVAFCRLMGTTLRTYRMSTNEKSGISYVRDSRCEAVSRDAAFLLIKRVKGGNTLIKLCNHGIRDLDLGRTTPTFLESNLRHITSTMGKRMQTWKIPMLSETLAGVTIRSCALHSIVSVVLQFHDPAAQV